MASTSIMMLPLEGEYLVAVYGTMKTSYEEPLEEVTASILDTPIKGGRSMALLMTVFFENGFSEKLFPQCR